MNDVYEVVLAVAAALAVTALVVHRWTVRRGSASELGTEKLAEMERTLFSLQGALGAQMRDLDVKVSGVSNMFVNDGARGRWGELTLRMVLERAGMVEGRDFEMQSALGNGRPDAVILLPGDRRLVVDSKFPVVRFNETLDIEDPEQRRMVLRAQGAELEKEAKALQQRGYQDAAAGGFLVMYVPSEAIFQAVMAADPALYDRLVALRVFIAGPSSLTALLYVAAHLLAEQRSLLAVGDIVENARELHRRLKVFSGHLSTIGARLGGAVEAYNKAVGSWQSRLSKQASKLAEHAGLDELDDPDAVEAAVRELAAPEEWLESA